MLIYLLQDPAQSYLPFPFVVFEQTPILTAVKDVLREADKGLQCIGILRKLDPQNSYWLVISSLKKGMITQRPCNDWSDAIISMINQLKAHELYSQQIIYSLKAWGKWITTQFGNQPIPILRTDHVKPLSTVLGDGTPVEVPQGRGLGWTFKVFGEI